jgi:hypothetical protein
LKGTGFPLVKIDAVRGAIRTHMFYRDPVGPEALYLHDADALDWLGAIGVARIMALVDPNGGDPDGPKAVKMLADNLAKVPARVLSTASPYDDESASIGPRSGTRRNAKNGLLRDDQVHRNVVRLRVDRL